MPRVIRQRSPSRPILFWIRHPYSPDTTRDSTLNPFVLTPNALVWMLPVIQVVDGLDPRLQELFGASEAGAGGCEEDGILSVKTEASRSEECVLFGVHADAEVVPGA